ncbi:MAG: hypothetical protein K8R10_01795 [Rhodocyclales bacterium]|jgi:hypothetical protein|nr:hypothetical protein [Rhodocyclales bacterium]
MGQVIDFYTAREVRQALAPEARCRCSLCGADLWHINQSGEVCCADCETVCPYRLQGSSEQGAGQGGRRQAECSLAGTIRELNEEDSHG